MNLAESTAKIAELCDQQGVEPGNCSQLTNKIEGLKQSGILTAKETFLLVAALGALSTVMACHHGATGQTKVNDE